MELKHKSLLMKTMVAQLNLSMIFLRSMICRRTAKRLKQKNNLMSSLIKNIIKECFSDTTTPKLRDKKNYLLWGNKKLIKKLQCIRLLCLQDRKTVNGLKTTEDNNFKDIPIQQSLGFITVRMEGKLLLLLLQKRCQY